MIIAGTGARAIGANESNQRLRWLGDGRKAVQLRPDRIAEGADFRDKNITIEHIAGALGLDAFRRVRIGGTDAGFL